MSPSAIDTAGSPAQINGSHAIPSGDPKSVVIVGAGPAGLMLASNLARYGIDIEIVDDRPTKTSTGRADGLQPKTLETFKQLRLADSLVKKGVKVFDICFWNSTATSSLSRTSREIHYPKQVDTLDPYVLLVHQGMIEDIFIDDMKDRGVEVTRSSPFMKCSTSKGLVETICEDTEKGVLKAIESRYIVGCDGAHSKVRKCIPDIEMEGESGKAAWGVLDGVLETDFPDIWSKAVIHSETKGSVLVIPRERNMSRLYIELHPGTTASHLSPEIENQDFVIRRAQEIFAPYKVTWKSIEWFSVYRVGQRVASKFENEEQNMFIVGDAAHTHSPKAAQGMNVSMHDSFNLGWKLNLASRRLALPSLLQTYEQERRLIAQQLIDFDHGHADAFSTGDPQALAKNFDDNIRFISGHGAEYGPNALNSLAPAEFASGLQPGALLPLAKVTRFVDANPVDLQLDIPMLGQFRTLFFIPDVHASMEFLTQVCAHIESDSSIMGRATIAANTSYTEKPKRETDDEEFQQLWRYETVSKLFTFGIITNMDKTKIETAQLPSILKNSPWTFYIDDVMDCMSKYFGAVGGLNSGDTVVVNVRPDGYVGSAARFTAAGDVEVAKKWLDDYFSGFLNA